MYFFRGAFVMDKINDNDKLYNTSEGKLIYIQTADNKNGKWPAYDGMCKVGDATIDSYEIDAHPNSKDLRRFANKRIKEYMGTSGVPYIIQWAELAYRDTDKTWFRDYDVHNVLTRSGVKHADKLSGDEWFKTNVETVKKAISAVKENKSSISKDVVINNKAGIILRPEQKRAVQKTKKEFKKKSVNRMLWNAKMRFGKTISALELIKEMKYRKVIIITHRPVVNEGWFDDFKKMEMENAGYKYGSKQRGYKFEELNRNKGNKFIYFASMQDLRGSEIIGGKSGDKNNDLLGTSWDLVIIDEAHEGTQTNLANNVIDKLSSNKGTKVLSLSGTPFNILDQYDDSNTFTWDYAMEQESKVNWEKNHHNEHNPYAALPRLSMYTFEIKNHFNRDAFIEPGTKSFNFGEFFKVNDNNDFVYKNDVKKFLDNITSPDKKSHYPFSTRNLRNKLRHTLWILPNIKAANAMEKLMNEHSVFGNEYNIINVVKNGDDTSNPYKDVDKVHEAIGDNPMNTKTITLTVRKLTTGVTVKEWTGVVFLSNTNSAMQYLQAAFRAQTPYESKEFGIKTNCYVFDFAPDRALTIFTEAADFNSGVGKRNTSAQKENLRNLLNFLPIIGEQGNGMSQYKINTLLAKLKRAYAERAVQKGFDDIKLYNDELLMLDDVDLKDFQNLASIVGTTKQRTSIKRVKINEQGLTSSEYNAANEGDSKTPDTRSEEEIEAINKRKRATNLRRKMVQILRSVSIRIPLMIYGMDVDLNEDITIEKFSENIDEESWEEFMPVSKDEFKKFIKYYDRDVFIEAGNIIRNKLKSIEKNDPINRVREISYIFDTFRNPDKETVLTPWRVVNTHLQKTIGGFSFFKDEYDSLQEESDEELGWKDTSYSNIAFDEKTKILDINTKTGLYPLYAAISIYYRKYKKMINEKAGKFTYSDEIRLWKDILKNNIFVIAKTPMAQLIAQRTLVGYKKIKTNILYEDDLIKKIEKNADVEAEKIRRKLKVMKFDVIIGNPPYQKEDTSAGQGSGTPLYEHFVNLAKKMKPKLITFITPSVWFLGGKGLDDYRREMINDHNIQSIHNFLTPKDVFPTASLRGGVSFFLIDSQYDNEDKGVYIENIRNNHVEEAGFRKLKLPQSNMLIISNKSYEIVKKMIDKGFIHVKENDFSDKTMFDSMISVKQPFGTFHKSVKGKNAFHRVSENTADAIKIYDSHNKIFYIKQNEVVKNHDWIDKYKVLTPFANNVGTDMKDDNVNTKISNPKSACTETFLVIGAENDLSRISANNVCKYLQTKFTRFLMSLAKANQNGTRKTYLFVPNQDFSDNSDINWDNSIENIDRQLFEKYEFSNDEINFICKHIKK